MVPIKLDCLNARWQYISTPEQEAPLAVYSTTYRSNTSPARQAVEEALRAGGLVQVAGGTRFSYYGLPGQDRTDLGYRVRVGIRAMRLVRRYRSDTGIQDLSVGREKYYGKVTTEKVQDWAEYLRRGEFGLIKVGKCPTCSSWITVSKDTGKLVTHGHIQTGDCVGSGQDPVQKAPKTATPSEE